MRVKLYFHTLKYLKPKQLIFQLLRRIYRPKITFIDYTPKLRSQLKLFNKSLKKRQSLIKPNVFQFFNENGDLDQISWSGDQKEKLWRYNQHYFDDLNSLTSESRMDWHLNILVRWVMENTQWRAEWKRLRGVFIRPDVRVRIAYETRQVCTGTFGAMASTDKRRA